MIEYGTFHYNDNPNPQTSLLKKKIQRRQSGKEGRWGPCLIFKDRDPDTYKASLGICLANIVRCLSSAIHERSCKRKKNMCVNSQRFSHGTMLIDRNQTS